LIANYINAEELQNFTHVDGIYTKPRVGIDAKKLKSLSYNEANEMANFGANILHAKPSFLLENIPLRIQTFNHENKGTLITLMQMKWVLKIL
jgi:aspartokinase